MVRRTKPRSSIARTSLQEVEEQSHLGLVAQSGSPDFARNSQAGYDWAAENWINDWERLARWSLDQGCWQARQGWLTGIQDACMSRTMGTVDPPEGIGH